MHLRRAAALLSLAAGLSACGPEAGAPAVAAPGVVAAEHPAPSAGPVLPPSPVPTRFACGSDEDCVLDCDLGAVSWAWHSALAPRVACEDGCAGPDSGAPRCEVGRCLATHRDGTPMTECSGLPVELVAAAPMSLEVSARNRMQTTAGVHPYPYVFLELHNPTDREQRVQLLRTAVWIDREGGPVLLELAPEELSLRTPDGEAASETRVAWLEWASVPPGARREVRVSFGALPGHVPPRAFPYRFRITLRDQDGGLSAVDTLVRLGMRHPIHH